MAKKILVIDDEELVAKSLQKLLNSQGYKVTTAKSGTEAIDIVKENDFDLIISDVRMPALDGIQTIKQIRANLKAAGKKFIPEILITGYADRDKYEAAMGLMVIDYVYKPFDTTDFLKVVKNAIG